MEGAREQCAACSNPDPLPDAMLHTKSGILSLMVFSTSVLSGGASGWFRVVQGVQGYQVVR